MQDRAQGGADGNGVGFRDRMGQGDQFQVERTDGKTAAQVNNGDFGFVLKIRFRQLAPEDRGGERRRINRAAQSLPQVRDGAQVVFMGMGQDQTV